MLKEWTHNRQAQTCQKILEGKIWRVKGICEAITLAHRAPNILPAWDQHEIDAYGLKEYCLRLIRHENTL